MSSDNRRIVPSLAECYAAHHGKVSDKWALYLSVYEKLFAPYRTRPVRLLEIGVQNGGSLAIWREYFENATVIVGCDINPDCAKLRYDDPRIHVVVGDAESIDTADRIKSISSQFDIIIEDGSHTPGDVIKSFCGYFDILTDGGVFISEDMHASYWKEYGGGLTDPWTSMAFFRLLTDVVNHEHWGLPCARVDLLRPFERKYGIALTEATLSQIHSILFLNSLVVIDKQPPHANTLGQRVVVGEDDIVHPMREWKGSLPAALAQSASLDEQIQNLHDKYRELSSTTESYKIFKTLLQQECDGLREEIKTAEHRYNSTAERLAQTERDLADLHQSSSWKITAPLRIAARAFCKYAARRARMICQASLTAQSGWEARHIVAEAIRRCTGRPQPAGAPVPEAPPYYGAWSERFDTPNAAELARLEATKSSIPPLVVVVSLTGNTLKSAGDTIRALKSSVGMDFSVFPYVRGCSDSEREGVGTLLRAAGLVVADAADVGRQETLILVEGGAVVRPHGLRIFAEIIGTRPAPAIVYSDEDLLDARGSPHSPWFKPTFSPHLAEAGILLGRMLALRGAPARRLAELLATADADLAAMVRAAALALGKPHVVRIPHVLYHNVVPLPLPAPVVRPLPDPPPTVSILIPTRNGWNLLGPCLESLESTDWPRARMEIIVIDNGSDDEPTLRGLAAAEAAGKIAILRDDAPFNFARLNNSAARIARGEFLVLLNNDTSVRDRAWLRTLIAEAAAPGVGVVGTKLLYPDRTVQHGGVVLGIQGCCSHSFVQLAADAGGYMGLANITREQSAVTGACLAVRRDVFLAAGGLDENFRVAFNDVMLCLDLLDKNLYNVIVANTFITHYENKTRGCDDTPEKIAVWRHETNSAWRKHAPLLKDDPFYSPNLSLEVPYALAPAPRRRPAWRPLEPGKLRVMLLSCTHAQGHGVAVVIDQQVRALAAAGHEVILAGARSDRDFDYGGRSIVEVHDPRAAAAIAIEMGIDVIVAETPPFFSVALWTGLFPPVIALDYGEPPAELFADVQARREVAAARAHAFCAATRLLAISPAVAAECPVPPDKIVPIANSNVGKWGPEQVARRETVRKARGWEGRTVVLDVCRFHAAERAYKGVDTYARVAALLAAFDPDLAARVVFVLCGQGDADDVAEMQARGLVVAANVSDAEMLDLYAAADIYANFSQWEGYNLGIGQALAMGLPVVASDIPAHRAFGVEIAADPVEAVVALAKIAANPPERACRVTEWDDVLPLFVAEVEAVARQGA